MIRKDRCEFIYVRSVRDEQCDDICPAHSTCQEQWRQALPIFNVHLCLMRQKRFAYRQLVDVISVGTSRHVQDGAILMDYVA
jgi:hypothetical protein